ncbi:MAG: molybdate ABC transporter substrate-binding protein [Thermoleophilia bacterium]|nr:molybdate ABC transporter substrate-binding protein [Thermoleophilia bacterium]
MPTARSFLVLAGAVLAVTACAGAGERDAGADAARSARLTVYAAASLTQVFPGIDPAPRYSFGGSDELATQIREGAPADVYAAASPKYPQELYRAGLLEKPVTFASNRLVLVVPRDNPARIGGVEDVREPGTRLVIGAEGVPVGDYAREVLGDLGLRAALANVVSNEDDVKGVLGKVGLGEADAGFVYATDAVVAGARVRVVELPVGAQPSIEYQIAVVAGSENRGAARRFLGLVRSRDGRRALAEAGFRLP